MPLLALSLLACTATTPEPTPNLPATVSALVEVRLTEMPTGIPRSTNAPYPTYTPFPTPTKAPTPAPSPTATSTPVPTPTSTPTLTPTPEPSATPRPTTTPTPPTPTAYPQSELNPAAHGDAVTDYDTHRQTNGTPTAAPPTSTPAPGRDGPLHRHIPTMAARHHRTRDGYPVEGLTDPDQLLYIGATKSNSCCPGSETASPMRSGAP